MTKNIFILICIVCCYSCDSTNFKSLDQQATSNKISLVNLKNELSGNLNDLGDQLREINATFYNQDLVRAIIKNQASYCNVSIKQFNFAAKNYTINGKIKNGHTTGKCITAYQASKVIEIDKKTNESSSAKEFITSMENLQEEILSEDVPINEKQIILLMIASQQTSVDFINNNQDLFNCKSTNLKTSNWWNNWGRCAASILGGAVTQGTVGVIGGAGFGTIVFPIIGTASAAIVGGIGGSIGGALTGAALGCNGERSNNNDQTQTLPGPEPSHEYVINNSQSDIISKLCIVESYLNKKHEK